MSGVLFCFYQIAGLASQVNLLFAAITIVHLLTAGASKRTLEHVQLEEKMDEVAILRVIAVAFLAGVPVALFYIVRPARTVARRRIRWIAAGFLGIGTCYIGWGASWPGPNSVTLCMMGGGLLTFLVSTVCFVSSLFFSKRQQAPDWVD